MHHAKRTTIWISLPLPVYRSVLMAVACATPALALFVTNIFVSEPALAAAGVALLMISVAATVASIQLKKKLGEIERRHREENPGG